jgi:AAA family ATP:ADP antiporter
MGGFSQFTGIATMTMFAVSGWLIRRFGWRSAATLTPVILLLTGFAFFAFIIFDNALAGIASILSTTPLMLAVVFGAAQNIASKATKYSLFDPTKEMAYIPLDENSKTRGKAAIDVVGARLGKSGGSLIQAVLLLFIPITSMTPIVAVILFAIIVAWIIAVKALSVQFHDLQEKRERERLEAEKELTEAKAAS